MTMHIGHVALRVTDLDRAVSHIRAVLGLREQSRSEGQVLLSSNEKHHELQLIAADAPALDHVGLEVESEQELEALQAQALAAGAQALDGADSDGIGAALRFAGPAGIVYEVYAGMDRDPLSNHPYLRPGIRKLGHLSFLCENPAEIAGFWRDGLGLRVSDTLPGGFTWMRCDSDHHGLAVAPRPAGNVLHHYAWQTQDWGSLGQYCDDIARQGLTLSWGPVRHGPGFNFATYLPDADGAIIEVYADLLQVHDEAAYEPIDWSDEPRALNLWGPPPDEELLAAGAPVAAPEPAVATSST
jgi:catechol-2,3-dioxygenase